MSDLIFTKSSNNGIEFYVSEDGKTTGMSLTGLSLCAGISRTTLRELLGLKSVNKTKTANCIDCLKPFDNDYFIEFEELNGKVENNAKLVKSEVCATIISYYAYEARAKNETALKCHHAFVRMGIDGWIKKAVGYKEPIKTLEEKMDMLISMMSQQVEKTYFLEGKVSQLEPIVEEYQEVKDGIKTTFKGLDTLLTCMLDASTEDLQNKNELTLSEWLLTKNIRLDHGGIRKFGRTVAETFKTCTTLTPIKSNRKKENGKWSTNITVYREEHFPILEMALEQFIKS